MKYDRSMLALFIGVLGLPFLLSLIFYLIGLSQGHILTWHGFTTRLWAGPYFALGAMVCVFAFGLSLYWMKTDKKRETDADPSKVRTSERQSHTVIIDNTRWSKFQALGGAGWLDKEIDEAKIGNI